MTADTTPVVRSPADLIAAVPYLLGFHPSDSLTVVAVRGKRVLFAARHDLPEPGTCESDRHAEAMHVAAVVARQDVGGATVIGHGPADRVTPAVRRLADALRGLGVPVLDELRVTGDRFFSYLCRDESCCPAEGVPFDATGSAVAAAATYAGQVALPDRQSLVDLLAPITGPGRVAMVSATARARSRFAGLLPGGTTPDAGHQTIVEEGRAAVRAAVRRHRDGGRLTDDEVAWLGVLLAREPVRDHAWERIDRCDWQVRLWTDVLRRVEPAYAPAPACLLAFAAWRGGDGALACVAVERALRQDPDYPMAALLDDVLRYALPPSAVDDWPGTDRGPVADGRPVRRHRSRGRAR